ncbi:MAG: T9SS type A sorting domain-containing protein, partial [Ferruginibacter sp.]
TLAGTVLVKDIEPGQFSSMQSGETAGSIGVEKKNIIQANGMLYFPAATAAFGRELWQSNGTAAGTTLAGDVFAGPQSSDPEQITNGNGDIYFVADNGATGKELYSFKPLSGFTVPPSNTSDSIDMANENISVADGTNHIIATIKQTGTSPLNHFVKTKLTIDAAATVFNGRTLSRKHVDIEPAIGSTTATATVTLYFSQADFDQYNSDDNINPDLPTSPGDATGKSALRIIQYHGVGTAPGNYPGAEEIINPSDDSIVWNATNNYWEVSFTVTGFSGFYLSSGATGPLPVRLLSFAGALNAQKQSALVWKVAEQLGILRYEIERSNTANNFTAIGNVSANSQTAFTYYYTDATLLTGNNFYRLKIVDVDGKVTYSAVINISLSANIDVALYPVPAVNNTVTLKTKNQKYLHTMALLIDNNGRMLKQFMINSSQQLIDISDVAKGIYLIKLFDGTVLKLEK